LIEIEAAALRANLRFIRSQIGEHAVFCSVVKGNAYGHGIHRFVPLAESLGVRCFATANASEAIRVIEASSHPETRVMVMGHVDDTALEWAISEGVSFWVFDRGRLERASAVAEKVGRPARIHLELETGLHRTGLEETDLEPVAELIRGAGDRVVVEGVCTHFAGAESVANYLRIQRQRERFDILCDRLRALRVPLGLRHTACSAAALTLPDTVMDLVRVGIAQYGFWPSAETRMHYQTRTSRLGHSPLRRLLTWKSWIMSIKEVPAGEFVGYGNSYLTERKARIAVVPVGYADGYSRSLSNLGHVLVRGRRVPVVGTVSMNALMVEVTRLPSVAPGDEVVLVGRQGRRSISVASFSEMTRTVDYETLVRLPAHVPREVVGGAKRRRSKTDHAPREGVRTTDGSHEHARAREHPSAGRPVGPHDDPGNDPQRPHHDRDPGAGR